MSQNVAIIVSAIVSTVVATISLISSFVLQKSQRRTQIDVENIKIGAVEGREGRERRREYLKIEMDALRTDIELLQAARDIMLRIIESPPETYTAKEANHSLTEASSQLEEHYRKRYGNTHDRDRIKSIHDAKRMLFLVNRIASEQLIDGKYTSDFSRDALREVQITRDNLKEIQEIAKDRQISLLEQGLYDEPPIR